VKILLETKMDGAERNRKPCGIQRCLGHAHTTKQQNSQVSNSLGGVYVFDCRRRGRDMKIRKEESEAADRSPRRVRVQKVSKNCGSAQTEDYNGRRPQRYRKRNGIINEGLKKEELDQDKRLGRVAG